MQNKRPVKSDEFAVGYANPPAAHQFKPGRSGNPKGRPKGSLNVETILKRAMTEKVVITERGRQQTFTKLEVSFKQLMNKSASGDLAAFKILLPVVRAIEEQARQTKLETGTGNETDQKVMQNILKRLNESSGKQGQNQ